MSKMTATEKFEKQQKNDELRSRIESNLVLPNLNEWTGKWADWMDALINTSDLFIIGDDGNCQRITSENIAEAFKQHKNILDWITTGEPKEGGEYWISCQECLMRSAKKTLENWIWEHHRDLFAEYGYQRMEDAIVFFEDGFYRIYKIFVYGLNFDYSAEAFLAVKDGTKKRSNIQEQS